MQTITKLIKDVLYMPEPALVYELSRLLREIYPDKYILETDDYDFDLKAFVEAGRCQVRLLDDAHPVIEAEWLSRERGARLRPANSFQEVHWDGYRFKVLSITYDDCSSMRHCIIADEEQAAKEFFSRVCLFSSEVHGEILVYKNGNWNRDKGLMNQIAHATLAGLVLPKELLDTLILDFEGFFASKELYKKQGVAWKRGILMLGPPGNGKTHAIKAMVNRLGKPCLYVRSFRSARGTIHGNIEHVFHRARQAAPCLLVMEDLDTLVDKTNLSFFLNEMDGFASNEGILTVGTTNHPEKLDPAILERPSRFDRKIAFNLPGPDERRRFLHRANLKRETDLRLTEDQLAKVVERTEGFSFAYLKELCLSSMMAWMRDCKPGGMAEAMLWQVDSLLAQMRTEPPKPVVVEDDEDER